MRPWLLVVVGLGVLACGETVSVQNGGSSPSSTTAPTASPSASAPAAAASSPSARGSAVVLEAPPASSAAPVERPAMTAAPLDASASEEQRRAAVLEILTGGEPASRLPIRATDPGRPFDPDKRDKVAPRSEGPDVRFVKATTSGDLPPEMVLRIARQSYGRYRLCYGRALRDVPSLEGPLDVTFTLAPDGKAKVDRTAGGRLPSSLVVCVMSAFEILQFPSREDGKTLTGTLSLRFVPNG